MLQRVLEHQCFGFRVCYDDLSSGLIWWYLPGAGSYSPFSGFRFYGLGYRL